MSAETSLEARPRAEVGPECSGGQRGRIQPLRAWVVVPAFCEEETLGTCLDALDQACLPEGLSWGRWLILDDASPDATAAVARGWQSAHPGREIELRCGDRRLGQASRLEQGRQWFLSNAGADDVLVGTNADVVLDRLALMRLLEPFVADGRLVAAWGMSRPAGHRRGRRSSWFQMEVTYQVALARGPDAVRAEGRLWALRPQRLDGFAWRDGEVVEDLQLALGVERSRVAHRSVPDAVAWALPARGFNDFHRQTSRSLRARRAVPAVERTAGGSRIRAERALVVMRAAATAASSDPLGALAYCVARWRSMRRTRTGESDSLRTWQLARSTKDGASALGSAADRPGDRVRTILKAVGSRRQVDAWPLALLLLARSATLAGRRRGVRELTLRFRDGSTIRMADRPEQSGFVLRNVISGGDGVRAFVGAAGCQDATVVVSGPWGGSLGLLLRLRLGSSTVVQVEKDQRNPDVAGVARPEGPSVVNGDVFATVAGGSCGLAVVAMPDGVDRPPGEVSAEAERFWRSVRGVIVLYPGSPEGQVWGQTVEALSAYGLRLLRGPSRACSKGPQVAWFARPG